MPRTLCCKAPHFLLPFRSWQDQHQTSHNFAMHQVIWFSVWGTGSSCGGATMGGWKLTTNAIWISTLPKSFTFIHPVPVPTSWCLCLCVSLYVSVCKSVFSALRAAWRRRGPWEWRRVETKLCNVHLLYSLSRETRETRESRNSCVGTPSIAREKIDKERG